MHIDLRQLRHFIALHEHRSFVAAATGIGLANLVYNMRRMVWLAGPAPA